MIVQLVKRELQLNLIHEAKITHHNASVSFTVSADDVIICHYIEEEQLHPWKNCSSSSSLK